MYFVFCFFTCRVSWPAVVQYTNANWFIFLRHLADVANKIIYLLLLLLLVVFRPSITY